MGARRRNKMKNLTIKKILAVDDEKQVREFMKDFLEDHGFEVRVAGSGQEALKQAEKFQPDLMLLDVQMPGMDGLEVLKQVKNSWPHIRVIMVTGIDARETIEKVLSLGADNYMIKPLSLARLKQMVKEVL